MRKFVFLPTALVFLVLFTGLSSAQEISAKSHKGDKGISFSVSGLSYVGLGQFEGGIGGKYWISNKLALTSSIGISAYKTTSTSSYSNYSDSKSTYSRFSLFVGVEDHFFVKKRLSPYFGGGIDFRFSSRVDYAGLPRDNPPPGRTKKDKTTTNTFGIRGLCGIEYFLADWVSLAGQYRISYFYEKTTSRRTLVKGPGVIQPRERKHTATTLGLGTSSLVVTFYVW